MIGKGSTAYELTISSAFVLSGLMMVQKMSKLQTTTKEVEDGSHT